MSYIQTFKLKNYSITYDIDLYDSKNSNPDAIIILDTTTNTYVQNESEISVLSQITNTSLPKSFYDFDFLMGFVSQLHDTGLSTDQQELFERFKTRINTPNT